MFCDVIFNNVAKHFLAYTTWYISSGVLLEYHVV